MTLADGRGNGPSRRSSGGASLADVDLVLASTSRYRRELLARLTPRFGALAPDVDETALPAETAAALAARLAAAKARAVAARCTGALVVGSDQAAGLGGEIFGKPGNIEQAHRQLVAASGREMTFHTAVCLIDQRGPGPREFAALDTTRVVFRHLDHDQISRYLEREHPIDCAGSFKAESLGIALFERIESTDPTALIGLPLIALCRLLREAGVDVI